MIEEKGDTGIIKYVIVKEPSEDEIKELLDKKYTFMNNIGDIKSRVQLWIK